MRLNFPRPFWRGWSYVRISDKKERWFLWYGASREGFTHDQSPSSSAHST
jgi:hypothetical protein